MPNEVVIEGGAAAMADMRHWADQVAPAVAQAADPFTQRLASIVAAKVPRLTGQLAGSIEANPTDDGAEVEMGDGIEYAGWIEFGGTRGRPYIPEGRYLYPSAIEATDEFARLAAETADDTARRFAWSTPSA
jgi:phage gpG-like protein